MPYTLRFGKTEITVESEARARKFLVLGYQSDDISLGDKDTEAPAPLETAAEPSEGATTVVPPDSMHPANVGGAGWVDSTVSKDDDNATAKSDAPVKQPRKRKE